MIILAQNATDTQDTARIEETSCPPTNPFTSDSENSIPFGAADKKLSRYTFPKNVVYSTSKTIGVIKDVKNIPLSLKNNLILRFIRILNIFILITAHQLFSCNRKKNIIHISFRNFIIMKNMWILHN